MKHSIEIKQDNIIIAISRHDLSGIVTISSRQEGESRLPGLDEFDSIGIHADKLQEVINALSSFMKISHKPPYERWYFDLDKFEIVETKKGSFAFLSHEHRILTEGFGTAKILLTYKNDYRFDTTTINRMRERYTNYINEPK